MLHPYRDILRISEETEKLLEEKKIYFTFAYIDSIRCYKHEELIWEASGKDRVEKARECVKFFKENRYIPNQNID